MVILGKIKGVLTFGILIGKTFVKLKNYDNKSFLHFVKFVFFIKIDLKKIQRNKGQGYNRF